MSKDSKDDDIHGLISRLEAEFIRSFQELRGQILNLKAKASDRFEPPGTEFRTPPHDGHQETDGAQQVDTECSPPNADSTTDSLIVAEPAALSEHSRHKKKKNPVKKTNARASIKAMETMKDDSGSQLKMSASWLQLSMQSFDFATATKEKTLRDNRNRICDFAANHRFAQAPVGYGIFHPHGKLKVMWEIVGACLLLWDGMVLPVSLGWDLDMGSTSSVGLMLLVTYWAAMLYWTCDVGMTFNTGIYVQGDLVMDRKLIAWRYLRTWLMFDVCILLLDIVLGAFDKSVRFLKFARLLRVGRLLRLLKMAKLGQIIEESVGNSQKRITTILIAIVKTSFGMSITAHLMACLWFWLGRTLREDGEPSWIVMANIEGADGTVQYLHSLRWVLNSPAPPLISPESGTERAYDIIAYVFCLMVLGSAFSTITSTMAELRAINSESVRRRQEIRAYLSRQHCSFELTVRIMRFVDYQLERATAFSPADTSLISPTLQMELYVTQRSMYLLEHPMLALTREAFPDVFPSICATLQQHVYEKSECVFLEGSLADSMHITTKGSFASGDLRKSEILTVGIHWFDELSLFLEYFLHPSRLVAVSFAETFSLSGTDLVDCVKKSPSCAAMFCEYAKEMINKAQSKGMFNNTYQVQLAHTCCQQSQQYRTLYPDPKSQFANVRVSRSSRVPKPLEDQAPAPVSQECEELAEPNLAQFADMILKGDVREDKLSSQLHLQLPELDPDSGSHVLFDQEAERERAESSCISLIALVANRYDLFTMPQAPHVQLDPVDWDLLQGIIRWINPTSTSIQSALVLLAIRALGKSKAVAQQLPADYKRPEQAVIYLMDHFENVVPSVDELSYEGIERVHDALNVHEIFNLAQMLQGENCAGNVAHLQEVIQDKGKPVLQFYIMFLLGLMSGLAGGQGSRFMNAKNATAVITGIRMLQHLLESSPRAIYWGFIAARAKALDLPIQSAVELAFVRLACLSRVQDDAGKTDLRTAWNRLTPNQQTVLVDHFLADGIEEQALVLEFLPLCVANAKTNPCVGVKQLLEVLVDLVNSLQPSIAKIPRPTALEMVTVDLSDLAHFIASVHNRYIFQTCISRTRLQIREARAVLDMTSENWSRTQERDSDITGIAYGVREMIQRQEQLSISVSKMAPSHAIKEDVVRI